MPETENQATTVELWKINSKENTQRKQWFLEKGVKNVVNFFAKISNQPHPETGAPQSSSTQQPTYQENQAQETLPQEWKKTSSFFDTLVNSTQNLLNKTENFVATAADKTKEITQQIREVPGKVAEKTNTVIQKGVNLGEKVKDRAETLADKGIDFGKTLQTTMSEGAQQFSKNPLNATGNIIKGTVNSTAQLGKDLWNQVEEIWKNTIESVKTSGVNMKDTLKNAWQEIQINRGNIETKATNVFWAMKEVGKKVVEKTKEVGINTFDTAKDVVKNPINHIDEVMWGEHQETTTLTTETENTTHLENLEKGTEE